MSGSDWYTRNAHWLAGSFFLLVLCVVGYFTLLNTGYNEGYKDAQTASGSAEANYELYERCFRINIREEVLNCLETQIKPARADERAEEDLQAQRNMAFWALCAFIASVVVGTLSVFVTAVGVVFVRDTLNVSRSQLVASKRPWLKVEPRIVSGLDIDDNDVAKIEIFFEITNIGEYPASKIWMDVELNNLLEHDGHLVFAGTDPHRVRQNLIDESLSRPNLRFSDFLFPDDSSHRLQGLTIKCPSDPEIGKALCLQLICCVRYTSGLRERPHITAIVREIKRLDNSDPDKPLYQRLRVILMKEEGSIRMEDLHISKSVWASDYAD